MNVMDHCEVTEDRIEVNSSSMYPAMVAALSGMVTGIDSPAVSEMKKTIAALSAKRQETEMARLMAASDLSNIKSTPNPIFDLYLPRVARLPVSAWDMASQPMIDDDGKMLLSDENADLRERALELCRLIYTELLHQHQGGGAMSIRLSKDARFRIRR